MANNESNRYNPQIHGDPEVFINRPVPYGLRWFEDRKVRFLRRSSVLTAVFTPFTREFRDVVNENYPPEATEDLLADVRPDIGQYRFPRISTNSVFSTVEDSNFFGTFDSYCQLIATQRIGDRDYEDGLNPHILVPVGNYGERFAIATANAAGVLSLLARKVMANSARKLTRYTHYAPAIYRDTFREIPEATLAEGMQTIAASIGLLMDKPLPGFENDPINGTKHLIDNKVFQHFAAHCPSGVIIRMTERGISFPFNLKVDIDGNLDLSDELISLLKREKPYKEDTGQGRLSHGCPVAFPQVPYIAENGRKEIIEDSGVQLAMEAFFPYLEYYYSKG